MTDQNMMMEMLTGNLTNVVLKIITGGSVTWVYELWNPANKKNKKKQWDTIRVSFLSKLQQIRIIISLNKKKKKKNCNVIFKLK